MVILMNGNAREKLQFGNVVHGCSFCGSGFCLDLSETGRCIRLLLCAICVYIFEAPNNRIRSNRTDPQSNEIALAWIANSCAPILFIKLATIMLDECIFMIVRRWYRMPVSLLAARCDPNHLLNFDELLLYMRTQQPCAHCFVCIAKVIGLLLRANYIYDINHKCFHFVPIPRLFLLDRIGPAGRRSTF